MTDKKRLLAVSLAAAMLTGCAAEAAEPEKKKSKEEESFSVSEITPGSDFYGYVNAETLMGLSLEENESSAGVLSEINKTVDDQINELISEIAADDSGFEPGSNEQLIHDLYSVAYRTATGELDTDAADNGIIDGIVEEINSAESMDELFEMWGKLFRDYECCTAFQTDITLNAFDSESYVLYLQPFQCITDLEDVLEYDSCAADLRDRMRDYLSFTGVEYSEAKDRATDIVYMILDIASATDFDLREEVVNGKKFHEFTRERAESTLVNLSYDDVITLSGLENDTDGHFYVADEKQFFMIDSMLDNEHLDEWKDYTVCGFLSTYADALPSKYTNSENEYLLPDMYATEAVKTALEPQLGEIYAERYFTEEKREKMTELCMDIAEEYKELIGGCEWLSDEGKQQMLTKLDCMKFYIGADEKHETDPEDAELVKESVLECYISFGSAEAKRRLSFAGQPADKNAFREMTPQTVNAAYIPEYNSFIITAAIASEPLFDENGDYYENLGGLGVIIGHELSHGFDSDCIDYDEKGNFNPDRISEEDREAFRKMGDRTAEYYSSFKVLDTYHVNGRKTLGENFADISALQCALSLAETDEQKKTVFESYARTWRELILDSTAKEDLRYDTHSPAYVRVNAVVACFDDFYRIYGVKEGDSMYVSPEDRIRRW